MNIGEHLKPASYSVRPHFSGDSNSDINLFLTQLEYICIRDDLDEKRKCAFLVSSINDRALCLY